MLALRRCSGLPPTEGKVATRQYSRSSSETESGEISGSPAGLDFGTAPDTTGSLREADGSSEATGVSRSRDHSEQVQRSASQDRDAGEVVDKADARELSSRRQRIMPQGGKISFNFDASKGNRPPPKTADATTQQSKGRRIAEHVQQIDRGGARRSKDVGNEDDSLADLACSCLQNKTGVSLTSRHSQTRQDAVRRLDSTRSDTPVWHRTSGRLRGDSLSEQSQGSKRAGPPSDEADKVFQQQLVEKAATPAPSTRGQLESEQSSHLPSRLGPNRGEPQETSQGSRPQPAMSDKVTPAVWRKEAAASEPDQARLEEQRKAQREESRSLAGEEQRTLRDKEKAFQPGSDAVSISLPCNFNGLCPPYFEACIHKSRCLKTVQARSQDLDVDKDEIWSLTLKSSQGL